MVEKIRLVYQNPREAIEYFKEKVLCRNTVTTKTAWFEERSPKSNLFGEAVFSANSTEEMMRDSYILLLLLKGDPLPFTEQEIALDIVDYSENNGQLCYQILFRHGFKSVKSTFQEVTKGYRNPFESNRAA